MLKHARAVLIIFLLSLSGSVHAEADRQSVLHLSGYFLTGEVFSLPSAIDQGPILLVIAEGNPSTDDLSGWQVLASKIKSEISTAYLAVLGKRRGFDRTLTAGRMRADVRDPNLRSSMVPVFEEVGVVRRLAGITSSSSISAILVTKEGEIIWRAAGPADQIDAEALLAAVHDINQRPVNSFERLSSKAVTATIEAPESLTPVDTIETQRADALLRQDTPTAKLLKLPDINGYTLAGQKISLPLDLRETSTSIVLFSRHQGAEPLLQLLAQAESDANELKTDWLVLVFMGNSPSWGRAIETGKLRAEIGLAQWRDHVVPVYMEISAFERLAGLSVGEATPRFFSDRTGVLSESACSGVGC